MTSLSNYFSIIKLLGWKIQSSRSKYDLICPTLVRKGRIWPFFVKLCILGS